MNKKIFAITLAAALAATGGYTYYKYRQGMARVAAMNAPILPEFEELAPGPRAPGNDAFELQVGESTLDEVEALVERRGLVCRDTSVRALMQTMREQKLAEIEEKKARGEDVDGMSGASLIHKKSKRERNPQVRLSCEDTPGPRLGDRRRPAAEGRVLFIFDSPEHPLRHVSFRRNHARHPFALDDARATVSALTEAFGAPHRTTELPAPDEDGAVRLKKLHPHRFEWRWQDLRVELTARSFGARGVDVNEVVEVPWPVRADAPTLPGPTKKAPDTPREIRRDAGT